MRVVWEQYSQGGDFHGLVSLAFSNECLSHPRLAPTHGAWTLSVSSRAVVSNGTHTHTHLFPTLDMAPLSNCMALVTTGFAGEG